MCPAQGPELAEHRNKQLRRAEEEAAAAAAQALATPQPAEQPSRWDQGTG